MPPVLNPIKSKVDGLAFLGLSLARNHFDDGSDGDDGIGHKDSATHQTSFDLNLIVDRDYDYFASTGEEGWMVGGGEPGPPTSYKMAAKDSAHVEIMRIGTYEKKWGGIPRDEIIEVLQSGKILIPQMEVVPTGVIANPDTPPEIQLRFDMVPEQVHPEDENLPVNWQLKFLHNQLFKYFEFPSRFCPGPFHAPVVRRAEFRSTMHRTEYFTMCQRVVDKWQAGGPKPLNTIPRKGNGQPIDMDDQCVDDYEAVGGTARGQEVFPYESGIWLFTDRNSPTHFFRPNFYPPYDTPEKRKVIHHFLTEEWDESRKQWKDLGTYVEMDDMLDDLLKQIGLADLALR